MQLKRMNVLVDNVSAVMTRRLSNPGPLHDGIDCHTTEEGGITAVFNMADIVNLYLFWFVVFWHRWLCSHQDVNKDLQ